MVDSIAAVMAVDSWSRGARVLAGAGWGEGVTVKEGSGKSVESVEMASAGRG